MAGTFTLDRDPHLEKTVCEGALFRAIQHQMPPLSRLRSTGDNKQERRRSRCRTALPLFSIGSRSAALALLVPRPCAGGTAAIPEGVWLIDVKAAVQTFECSGLLYGRMLWLQVPRDRQSGAEQTRRAWF